ncbi:MAG TPA: MBL fold metallo-hydrolase [Roseococcus sp.]|nr:MBL fold metallo-hydrolase [Roseococcus sp.]
MESRAESLRHDRMAPQPGRVAHRFAFMSIHVINCGWLRPLGGRLWDGTSDLIGPGSLACRCLLVETADGLVLVDSGFGLLDSTVAERLPAAIRIAERPDLRPGLTAIERVRRLGFEPRDVAHVVMTHLDFDHAGGLTDFPWAQVHVSAQEADCARQRPGLLGRMRWRPAQMPATLRELAEPGDDWFGLATLAGAPGGIRLVPLPGHTPGHCGIAVPQGDGWVLHAGDAIFMMSELDRPGDAPPLTLAYEALMEMDGAQRQSSAETLRALRDRVGAEVCILCTHDPAMPHSPRVVAQADLND